MFQNKICIIQAYIHSLLESSDLLLDCIFLHILPGNMLDSSLGNYTSILGEYPVTHVTANSVCYTKPPTQFLNIITKIGMWARVIPNKVVKVKITQFADVRSLPCNVFQRSSTM